MSDLKQELEAIVGRGESADPGVQALFGGGKMLMLLKFIAENWDVIKQVIDKFQASSGDARTAGVRAMGVSWLELLQYVADNWEVIAGMIELFSRTKGPKAL